MPRRPKGWTPNQFFDNREMHRRRPLVMNAQPSTNTNIAQLEQQTGPANGNSQRSNGPASSRRARQNAIRGTSFVRDNNGVFQAIQALIAPRAIVPGIMEAYLHRLGLEAHAIDTGAQVVRRRTPMGPLELVGTASLVLRLRNQTSSRRITVQVWRGDEGNRYGLYFDPANGSQFLEPEENHSPQPVNGRPDQNTAAATALPQRLRLDHPPTPPSFDSDSEHTPGRQRSLISNAASPVSPNSTTGSQAHTFDTNFTSASEPDLLDAIMEGQVFPQGSWGLMETAVMVGNNSITATLMENPTHEYNHLATPLDLTTDFVPHSHLNHHQMAPNGFCSQCFDDALSAAADH